MSTSVRMSTEEVCRVLSVQKSPHERGEISWAYLFNPIERNGEIILDRSLVAGGIVCLNDEIVRVLSASTIKHPRCFFTPTLNYVDGDRLMVARWLFSCTTEYFFDKPHPFVHMEGLTMYFIDADVLGEALMQKNPMFYHQTTCFLKEMSAGLYSDVTLVIPGHGESQPTRIRTHRRLLELHSEMFRGMGANKEFSDSGNSEMVLKDVDADSVLWAVSLLYEEKRSDDEHLIDAFEASDRFVMTEIIDDTVATIRRKGFDASNVIFYCHMCDRHPSLNPVRNDLAKHIRFNTQEFIEKARECEVSDDFIHRWLGRMALFQYESDQASAKIAKTSHP